MIIQHNLLAMNAQRQFQLSDTKKSKSSEKLSSGYRINRSADDAAGLAISEKMRRQIRGLNQASANIMDGVGYVQTGEGALNEVDDMLHRMTELAVQASNDTNTDQDREYIDMEIQQIKSEMSRVFETTSFNERLIWQPDPDKLVQVGTEKKYTVTFKNTHIGYDVTDSNKGFIPYNGIKLAADEEGIKASWKAYDGNTYETSKVDWDTVVAGGYSFKLEDYMPDSVKDGSGNPPFTFTVGFTPNSYATRDDIIAAINQSSISTSTNAYYELRFEDSSGNKVTHPAMTLTEARAASFAASYVSAANGGHTFDAPDDAFIEPSPSPNLVTYPSSITASDAREDGTSWTFKFNMQGIGGVTANCVNVKYYSYDHADDDLGYWWDWRPGYIWVGNERVYEPHYQEYQISRNLGNTLKDVMKGLTGEKGDDPFPGLLNSDNGGDSDSGGMITFEFRADADSAFSSGSASGKDGIFTFQLWLEVGRDDTEQSVLDKINSVLNADTRLDVYIGHSSNNEGAYIGTPTSSHKIDTPVYDYDQYEKGNVTNYWGSAVITPG